MSFLLGGLILVGAVVFFVIQPLLSGEEASLEKTDDEMSEAEARRRVKLLALRDVELDFASGKLDDEDYRSLKLELSAEALEALEVTEREQAGVGDPALEEEIAAARSGLATVAICAGCGHPNQGGSRFCSRCGGALHGMAPAESS